jgi:alkanesulfonate monooxygenase SsuD/methylene tetrahydromethanopterin reductase-like flavin-dependent oxidoreductase (luciferase family)
LKIGIFSNQQRHRQDILASWEEDIAEIKLADQLGFEECWISEHTGLPYMRDGLACPDHMICRLAGETEQIRMGPAVRRLALYDPVQVAVEIATIDHLTRGRYMWAFGHGGAYTGYEQHGIRFEDTHDMMFEYFDVITRCINQTAPFDYQGRFFQGVGIETWPKPMNGRMPQTWFASSTPDRLAMGAGLGLNLFLSQFDDAARMKRASDYFCQARLDRGLTSGIEGVTALRAIYVGETDARAIAEVEASWTAHLDYNKKHFPHTFKAWIPPGGTYDDVTFASLLDGGLIFAGSAATVCERITDLHARGGGFGRILAILGKDWATFDQRADSLRRLAQDVAPALATL